MRVWVRYGLDSPEVKTAHIFIFVLECGEMDVEFSAAVCVRLESKSELEVKERLSAGHRRSCMCPAAEPELPAAIVPPPSRLASFGKVMTTTTPLFGGHGWK